MQDPPRIESLPAEDVFNGALKVVACISEALELTPTQRHYAALALEANAGELDSDPTYARLARAVALQLREDGQEGRA
ncbi:hypothetical protein [Limimaricola sp. AA108-03]|uniref:hypothetical protein n=1 Tax=Limimaricola sp. AA108-03 TaxID=3425945 RepID=UPI003D775BF1